MNASSRPSRHGLTVRIAIRLAAAAAAICILEIGAVLMLYDSNRAKLAEQFLTIEATRIAAIARATPTGELHQRLTGLAAPRGVHHWDFSITDVPTSRLLFAHRVPAGADLPGPRLLAVNWTQRNSTEDMEKVRGARRLTEGSSDLAVTLNVEGDARRLYGGVFLREAVTHVLLPVLPLTLVLLLINVQIIRRMLAPLSSAAAEVDSLNPAQMTARLNVPDAPDEVRALVLAVNRALDRLQHSIMVLESFTGDAAHELRTPLSVLRLRLDALHPGPLKDRLIEDLAAVTRLADQLLDLAQADVLEVPEGATVSLGELAGEVAARLHPVAFARGCDIQLTDHGDVRVKGHREALARVLTNLIDNAVGHSPQGGVVEIIVGPGARLAICDQGPGIPPEEAHFLFKRFWRGPAQARDGAGLGLAIAHSILTRHGATITAGNSPRGGAIFTLGWPGTSTLA